MTPGPGARDLARLPDPAQDAGLTGPARVLGPVYVDLLPPCNAACPGGESIQAWLAAPEEEVRQRWAICEEMAAP